MSSASYQNHFQLFNGYDALPTRPAIDVGWAVYIKAKGMLAKGKRQKAC
ncbi:MAG: hypothetical protein F6J98_33660 [Moorea sp. SIO4G2]|nr:hypothetical protein [Moorena sp. SIO4G2]